jgi:hypothetical protein
LFFFALSLSSLSALSPTFDEQGFITRGLGYVRGENRHMRVGHPLGLNALNAAFLAGDTQVTLPVADPSWQLPNFHRPSELFLWEIGNDVAHVMFLARLPTLFLGMLLAAVTGRWAWEITRSHWAGLLALSLAAFDPNLIAHSRLATTDLGLAAGATLAGFLLWRYWQKPSWPAATLAGVGFGLLQNTKFTAGLFVPLFALVMGIGLVVRWREKGRFPRKVLAQLLIAYPLAAFLTLWAAYGFQIGTLPPDLPTLPQLGGLTLPLSHHLEQLLDIGSRMQQGTPSFLWGQYSDSGWWYYFPVAFLLKTPLPTLLLLAGAGLIALRHRPGKLGQHTAVTLSALLIPSLGYFAIALTTDINLGYRHILPVLPFLFVFVAAVMNPPRPFWAQNLRFIFPAAMVAWLALITITIYPHFLAYFNALAGGPDGGWRYLVDSNLDWGQDLGGLKDWMDENSVEQVWLSYFGEGRPSYYNINFIGLDSWPPRLMNPQARPFYPHNPAPGIYAISATNLQGVHFANYDQFAWFRDQEPLVKIGYTIFLYEVEAYGEPVDLALGSVQLDELASADYALLQTNVVTPHWFDPAQSLLIPQNTPRWLALAAGTTVSPPFQAVIDSWEKATETPTYKLYRIPPLPPDTAVPLATFTNETGTIALMDIVWEQETAVAGEPFTLRTGWLKAASPQPLKIFLHLIAPGENIVAQWDGLGAAWEGWRADDVLWQYHTLAVPGGDVAGTYQIWAGLYHPDTGERWQSETGDRLLLGELVIGE